MAFSSSRSKILAAQAKSRIDQNFDLQGENSTGFQFAFSPSHTGLWDIWTEIYGSASNTGNSKSSLWVGYVGAHVFTSENQLIGLVGQIDRADETNGELGGKADGFGWMAGPYIAGQFPGQNRFYEARIAYGRSDNNISPVGTYSDTFNTERWLASAKLSDLYEIDDLAIKSEIRVSWYQETQESYMDSLSNTIPLADGAFLTPEVALYGVWNFDVNNAATGLIVPRADERFRARIDLGLALVRPENGLRITTSAYYDGIGTPDFNTWGGRARLTIPLN